MKNKITQSLVLLFSLFLWIANGQNTGKKHNDSYNSKKSDGLNKNIKNLDIQIDSLSGSNGENRFFIRWNYDKNKITQEEFKVEGNKRIPYTKTERLYFDNGLIKVEFKYNWIEALKKYQPSSAMNGSKTEFLYDDKGNNLFQYQYYWSTDKESFLPYDKEEFKYNADGNKILRLWYTWNSELEKFNLKSKVDYKYDKAGNIIESNWYTYKSYKNDFRDEFFLDSKYIYTYNEFLNTQYCIAYTWDSESGQMQLFNKSEVSYSFKENKKFSINNHKWEAQVLKNKYDNKTVHDVPRFLIRNDNDIATAKTTSNRAFKYDDYGICVLYNTFSTNVVTNNEYKSSSRIRTKLYEDSLNLVYHYTDSDYDLDFYKWEIDKEWKEYYSKVEK